MKTHTVQRGRARRTRFKVRDRREIDSPLCGQPHVFICSLISSLLARDEVLASPYLRTEDASAPGDWAWDSVQREHGCLEKQAGEHLGVTRKA